MSSASKLPEEKWADVGELRMRYLDWGGDGPPVLALHGLASTSHWYDPVSARVQDQFHVIAPDQRGHGQTTQAGDGYDWHTLASDAVGLLDNLGIEKAAVLGHSWGGQVAINVAAHFPERVEALVMIDGGFFTPSLMPGTWEDFKERLSPRNVSGTREDFLDRMRSQLYMAWNDEIERIVQTMVYEDDDGQIQDILRPENQAQVIKAMWDEPASLTWAAIASPTLIVPAGPMPERAGSPFADMRLKMVAAASEGISNSRVHWIPETIHDIGWHKPDELASAISNFLANK